MARTYTNEELSRMVDEISEALNNKMDRGGRECTISCVPSNKSVE